MTDAQVAIERMLYGGGALAHAGDQELIVPFTLPGERVAVTYDSASGVRAEAGLVQVVEASQDRAEPLCIHFGHCGGCQYQHATYATQLAVKHTLLTEMLGRAGIDAPTITVHGTEPYGYRNRIQLRVEKTDGAWRVGYHRRASHEFMEATMCPITAEPLWALAVAIREALNSGHAFGTQPLSELELFCNQDGSAMQAVAVLDVEHAAVDRDAPKHFRQLCDAVKMTVPALAGAGLWVWSAAPQKHGRGRAQQRLQMELAAWGEPLLQYAVGDARFPIERGGFFQVNRAGLGTLLDLATRGASGTHAWDLYAGVGLFSSQLQKKFTHVTAVEIGERSFRSLAARLNVAGKQHRALRLDTLEFLKQEAKRLPAPDLVVVDPPRSGLGGPVARSLGSLRPREIRYVSCDATTLVRDLKTLIESGYCLAELTLVDMFPQTFHMESAVRLVLP